MKFSILFLMSLLLMAAGCSAPVIRQHNNPSLKLFCKEHGGVECDEAYEWAEH